MSTPDPTPPIQTPTPQQERILRRVRAAQKFREFVRMRDGRTYFVPRRALVDLEDGRKAFPDPQHDRDYTLSADVLRALADELDRRNIAVTQEVEREFKKGCL